MTGHRADTFGIRPAALDAWQALTAALHAAAVLLCAGRDEWLSDDPTDRAEAAEACQHCPVIQQCKRFATTNRETAGVWAGTDHTPTAGRPAQRKELSA